MHVKLRLIQMLFTALHAFSLNLNMARLSTFNSRTNEHHKIEVLFWVLPINID